MSAAYTRGCVSRQTSKVGYGRANIHAGTSTTTLSELNLESTGWQMSHGVREARPIELMKSNNLLVLVFRRTKIENMLCRLQHGWHHSSAMQDRGCSPILEMLGGQNFYFRIDVRPSSSECAQNHCLFLEDRRSIFWCPIPNTYITLLSLQGHFSSTMRSLSCQLTFILFLMAEYISSTQ